MNTYHVNLKLREEHPAAGTPAYLYVLAVVQHNYSTLAVEEARKFFDNHGIGSELVHVGKVA